MKCLGDGPRVYIKRSVKRSILSSTKRRAASIPISKKLFRSSAFTAFMILGVLLAALTLSPMRGLVLRGGSVTAFVDESIATYAADFSTPKSDWNLGQTANAKATASPDDRRIAWVAPDGKIAQVSSLYSDTLNDSYNIPSGSDPFAQVGTWTVETIDASGTANTSAKFVVHDPATANADLAVGKFGPTTQISAGGNISYRVEIINHGPDDAQAVSLTDSAPANTTFVSEAQNSGPAFTCNGTGTVNCTIATLPVNAVAIFSFTYNVNAGTPDGTLITNVASISSSTNDPRLSDNAASASNTVIGASNVCTLSCPGDISANATGCTAVVTYSTPAASGNCGTDPVLCSPPSGSIFPIGTTTVNCNVASGGSCSFNVVVTGNDTTPPTLTCPSDITTPEDPAGSGDAHVTYATPAANDNCTQTQDVVVSCSPPSGSSFPTGTTQVTCTATDASNNSASCTFNVTVAANNCAITCPADVTESTSSGCSKVVTYAAPTQSGSCGTVGCDPASGSSFPVGTTTVICAARDTSGNLLASCNFTVTVNDTGALTCPANITVNENPPGSGSAPVNYQEPVICAGTVTCTPPPSDNEAGTGQPFPLGTTTVTCTSSTGPTCSFTITVTTAGACAITCPANITKANDPGQCGAIVTFAPTTSGNCGSDPTNCQPPSGSFFPKGTTSVTCNNHLATDCTFTVTVTDTQAPAISCPADITTTTAPGLCSAVATYATPTASDNCSGVGAVSCSPASGSTFAKGTTTVTCSATDGSGNIGSCTFTVTVTDNQNPTISCPANIVQSTDPNLCSAVVNFAATANDNCPGVTYGCTPAAGSAFAKGTTTVTCTATDTSGNMTGCQFTVTVNDTQPPAIACVADIVVDFDPAVNGAVVTYSTPVGTDNCPGATTAQIAGLASGATFPAGNTTNTFEVTDAVGLTSQCSFKVTVALTSIIGRDSASITGSGLVDSYDSTGGYPATKGSLANLLSNGTVAVSGSSNMFGNVRSTRVGVNVSGTSTVTGNATAGTTVTKGTSATIGGTITNNLLAPVMTMPLVPACGPPYSPNSGISGTYSYNPSTGDLTVSGVNIATLANGTYCFHNVALSNSGQLKVNGPVVIKLTGTFTASGATTIANTTAIPANLQVLSSFSGSNGVSISNGTNVYIVIYAPNTSVTISGAAPLFGTVTGKTLTISNSGMIHYDIRLKSIWPAIWSLIQ